MTSCMEAVITFDHPLVLYLQTCYGTVLVQIANEEGHYSRTELMADADHTLLCIWPRYWVNCQE